MRIIPLIILGILTCIGLGVSVERHGKPKKGIESGWASLINFLLTWGLILWVIF